MGDEGFPIYIRVIGHGGLKKGFFSAVMIF